MKKLLLAISFLLLLTACKPVDLDAAIPAFDTGVDPNSWAKIPAGEFLAGQFNAQA